MDVATTTAGLSDLKFRLVREDFADAVAWVARNLPTRPTVPVLAGVLLTGSDDGLTVSGFDYEVSAEVQVAAEIASPGSVLVSGRLLSDITRALPAKPVDVSVEGTRVLLNCGSAKFSLPTMAVEDYPTLPSLPDETGVVSADLFAEAIGQVAVCCPGPRRWRLLARCWRGAWHPDGVLAGEHGCAVTTDPAVGLRMGDWSGDRGGR